jgi:hypothetical protein
MRTNLVTQSLLVLALSAPVASYAMDVRPFFKAGYDLGGDTLINVTFTDGSSESVKANEGFYFGGGASIVTDSKQWEIELSLAYKFSMINASNGDIEFTRVPLEALVFYRFDKVRLGGGITYHLNPELDGSGVATPLNVKFDDALGFVLQADFRLTDKMTIGMRYTSLKYEVEGVAAASAKSDGLGFTFSYRF